MPRPGGACPRCRLRPHTRSACPQNATAREAPGVVSRAEFMSIFDVLAPGGEFSGCTWDVAGAWRVSTWAVQILQLAGGERRMAPDGVGGAALEGACDVHPVRGFEEDDLGSQGVAVEPAAGGGDRDGFA